MMGEPNALCAWMCAMDTRVDTREDRKITEVKVW